MLAGLLVAGCARSGCSARPRPPGTSAGCVPPWRAEPVPAGTRPWTPGSTAFGTTVAQPEVRSAGTHGALEVRFRVRTGLVPVRAGDASGPHSLLPITKRSRFVVVPERGRWLVNARDATSDRARARLVSGG